MNQIPESELILDKRGAIYHLGVRPEELAHTVIVVGDPDRVPIVSKYFDKVEHQLQHREFITHTGFIGHKRITVMSAGIGPDNIDIVMNELDALVNIDFSSRTIKPQLKSLSIFRFGTCGSLQAQIPVDSFVAGSYGLGFDNVMHYYSQNCTAKEAEMAKAFIAHTGLTGNVTPYIFEGSNELLQHFSKGFHNGITVGCPGFYGPQGRKLRLGLAYPGLIEKLSDFSYEKHFISNFEMETSAIYGLGRALNHRCLSLNVIVANRVLKQFSKDGAAAVENLIKTSLEVIVHNNL